MIKFINIGLTIFLISQFLACNQKSDSLKTETQIVDKPLVNVVLDSNFVLEDLAKLTSINAIESKFGNKNLTKDSLIAGPEGTSIHASILFAKTANEVVLYWKEKEKFKKLDAIVIRCHSTGYEGKWHSKFGLQPGQSLDNVLILNQKPFTISGFGWDYGGHIVSWEGGKLDNKKVTGRFADFGKSKISDQEYKSISGDTEFNINLEAIKKLNPVLEELTVFSN